MDRKGQVTLFVIIGLTLVLVAVLLFTVTTITKFDQPPEELTTHDFSAIIATYQAAAQACVLGESSLILKEIMSHGGYVKPEEQGFIALPDPTLGSAVTITQSSQELIPYWVQHLGGTSCSGSCPISTKIPPLEKDGSKTSIEYQVERELEQRTVTCLNSIELTHDYTFKALDEPKVTMTTGEDSITYHLERPIEITFAPTDSVTTTSTVVIKESVSLRPLYELGVSVATYAEITNSSQFLPRATKQIIQSFSLADGELPPMIGETSFAINPSTTWFLPTVEEELAMLLADNIPLIQIKGSADERLFLDPNYYSQALYNSGYFSPDIPLPYYTTLGSYSFDFFYNPSWGVDLKISPSSGAIIQPEGGTFSPIPIFQFGIYDYSFSYDLIYPVVVIIEDQEAFNGDGLTLMYAIETGLRNNNPINYDAITLGSDPHFDLFSRDEFRMDGLVTIETRDGLSQDPLEDVELFYACGDATTTAGISQILEERAISYTSLPQCIGGIITGQLEDYFALAQRLDIFGDEDHDVTLELVPYKEFEMKVRTHAYAKISDGFTEFWDLDNRSDGGFLGPEDEVIYIFTRKALPGEEDYTVADMATYSSETTISLPVGTYDVQAHLLRDFEEGEKHIIPATEECYDAEPLNPFNDDTCEEIPEIEFNTTMYLGGYASEFTLDNYTSSTLTLHIVEIALDDLTTHEDLAVLGAVGNLSENYDVLGVKLS